MNVRAKLGRILAAMLVVLAAGSTALAEGTKTVSVDCANGGTIAKALTFGDERKSMLVIVKGHCNETVTVERSDVALQGGPSGGGVNGQRRSDESA